MKPYLLVLLLAIPALVSGLLNSEDFAPAATDTAKPNASAEAPASAPAHSTIPATTTIPPRSPASAPTAKPGPTSRSTPTHTKPWWLM